MGSSCLHLLSAEHTGTHAVPGLSHGHYKPKLYPHAYIVSIRPTELAAQFSKALANCFRVKYTNPVPRAPRWLRYAIPNRPSDVWTAPQLCFPRPRATAWGLGRLFLPCYKYFRFHKTPGSLGSASPAITLEGGADHGQSLAHLVSNSTFS